MKALYIISLLLGIHAITSCSCEPITKTYRTKISPNTSPSISKTVKKLGYEAYSGETLGNWVVLKKPDSTVGIVMDPKIENPGLINILSTKNNCKLWGTSWMFRTQLKRELSEVENEARIVKSALEKSGVIVVNFLETNNFK